jgi:hypothetical protein
VRSNPLAVVRRDANANARAQASIHRGVRMMSALDEKGSFDLARTSRHVGKTGAGSGAIYVCPYAHDTSHNVDYPASARSAAASSGALANAYDAFLDQIIENASKAPGTAPGAGDVRLQGPRQ